MKDIVNLMMRSGNKKELSWLLSLLDFLPYAVTIIVKIADNY